MRFLRYLATLILPGTGHYAIGRARRGVLWLAATLLSALGLMIAIWLARNSPGVAAIFGLGALLALALRLGALIDLLLIKPREPMPSGAEIGRAWAGMFAALLATALITNTTLIQANHVVGNSMLPTLQPGDLFLVDLHADIAAGDIVALHPPNKPGNTYVKRVLGVAHDTIAFEQGVPVVSGVALPHVADPSPCSYTVQEPDGTQTVQGCERFAETRGAHRYLTYRDPDQSPTSELPVEVPEGQVFVVGDNRDHSLDSRVFGLVPLTSVIGKAFMIDELPEP
jgi:signal peptidase I